MEEKDIEGS